MGDRVLIDIWQFFLGLAIILISTYLLTSLFVRFRIPGIIAALFIGAIIQHTQFPHIFMQGNSLSFYELASDFGVMALLFFIGLEIDIKKMMNLSKVIIILTVLNTIIPFIFGVGVGLAFGYSLLISFIIGLTRMPTAEAVVVPILDEFGLIDTKIGNLIVGVGTLDDILEVFMIAFVSIIVGQQESGKEITMIIAGIVIFIVLALMLRKYVVPMLLAIYTEPKEHNILMMSMFILLLLSAVSQRFELGLIVGALIAGIVLQPFLMQDTEMDINLFDSIHTLTYGLLGPLFFFWIGFNSDIGSIITYPSLTILLFLAAFLGKMLGVYIVTFTQYLSTTEGIIVGVGLNTRLTTEIIVVQILFAAGIIDVMLYSALIAASAFSTLTVPLVFSHLITRRRATFK